MQNEDTRKMIERIEIPPLPMVAQKLLQTLNDPDASAQDLAQLISQDQALVEKVLKIANSAFYGLSREIKTISHSIVILGQHTVRNLVLGISIMGHMSSSNKKTTLNRKKFWAHSLKRAILARLIASKILPEAKEEAFIAGLIQDTGKLILDEYFTMQFDRALQEMRKKPQTPGYKLEQDIVGVDHQEVGTWLMDKWNFPPIYISTTGHHHQPLDLKDKSEHYKITMIVCLSDILAGLSELAPEQRKDLTIDPQVVSELGWTPANTEALLAQLQEEFDRAALLF